MSRYLLFLLPVFIFAKSSFITPIEYASSLYVYPRGIGCNKCHGEHGEGKLVASYIHKKEKKSFMGPKINNMQYKDFYYALNERKNGMPRYFLTKKEIDALYFFLNKQTKL